LVGNGSRIFVFSGLGLVVGLKWQICEKKQMSCTYNIVPLYWQAIILLALHSQSVTFPLLATPLLILGRDCLPRKLSQLNLFVGGCVQDLYDDCTGYWYCMHNPSCPRTDKQTDSDT